MDFIQLISTVDKHVPPSSKSSWKRRRTIKGRFIDEVTHYLSFNDLTVFKESCDYLNSDLEEVYQIREGVEYLYNLFEKIDLNSKEDWTNLYKEIKKYGKCISWIHKWNPNWIKQNLYLSNNEGFVDTLVDVYFASIGKINYGNSINFISQTVGLGGRLTPEKRGVLVKVREKIMQKKRGMYWRPDDFEIGEISRTDLIDKTPPRDAVGKALPGDFQLLNDLNKVFDIKKGFEGESKLIDKLEDKFMDTNRFYLLYDLEEALGIDCKRMLPIYAGNGEYTTFNDIFDNIWVFVSTGNWNKKITRTKGFQFYGYKNGIPIIKIKH